MQEARVLLKESVVAKLKGDIQAMQQLRAKAINRSAGTTILHAPKPTSVQEVPAPAMERMKVELLEELEAVSCNLRRRMSSDRHASSPHPLRNYRRK